MIISANLNEVVYKATKDINKYNEETQKKMKNAVAKGVQAVKERAIRNAPMSATGNLKAGIKSEMSSKYASGVVKSTAPHSHLIEYGTQERIVYNKPTKKALVINGDFVRGAVHNGKITAKPFLRPALEAERPNIESEIERCI